VLKYIKTYYKNAYGDAKIDKDTRKKLYKLRDVVMNGEIDPTDNFTLTLSCLLSKYLPSTYRSNNFQSDVVKHTYEYLKCCYWLNRYVQKNGHSSYQFFPIRSSSYPKYVKIGTQSLINILYKTEYSPNNVTKTDYLYKAGQTDTKEYIWNLLFDLKRTENRKNRIHRPNYSFNYEICTDGHGVSMCFIKTSEIAAQNNKKRLMGKGRKISHQIKLKYKNNPKDYQIYLNNKKNKELEKAKTQREQQSIRRKEYKEKIRKLSSEDKRKLDLKIALTEPFPYVDTLLQDPEHCIPFKKQYDKGNVLFCDPGKRSLLYLMCPWDKPILRDKPFTKDNNFGVSFWSKKGENGTNQMYKVLNYTIKTRLQYTKRTKFNNDINKWKQITAIFFGGVEMTLVLLEQLLSATNSKSCDENSFLKYAHMKLLHYTFLTEARDYRYIHKLKWYSYINKIKHENKLISTIKREFGKDVNIVIGDWSGSNCLSHNISTPNTGLKRKLKEHFPVYHIDEYKTSKIHYRTDVECTKVKVKLTDAEKDKLRKDHHDKLIHLTKTRLGIERFCTKLKQKNPFNVSTNSREIHGVLTYKKVDSSSCISGCINRDKNACLNMERIFVHYLYNNNRMHPFIRSRIEQSQLPEILGKPPKKVRRKAVVQG